MSRAEGEAFCLKKIWFMLGFYVWKTVNSQKEKQRSQLVVHVSPLVGADEWKFDKEEAGFYI